MTGILSTKRHQFIFRDDVSDEFKIWAWDIHENEHRQITHKWEALPKNAVVELFDISNPPRTVTYIPILE